MLSIQTHIVKSQKTTATILRLMLQNKIKHHHMHTLRLLILAFDPRDSAEFVRKFGPVGAYMNELLADLRS